MQVGLLIQLKIGPFIRNCMKVLKNHSVLSHVYMYSTAADGISFKQVNLLREMQLTPQNAQHTVRFCPEVYSLKSKCNLRPGEVALDVLFTYSKL